MNRIIAVIPSESLESVKSALLLLDVGGITLSDIFEPARAIVTKDEWWGLEQDGMLRLEVISLPESVEEMVHAITARVKETARNPRGMVFVARLDEVIRVRTEEISDAAIL